MRILALCLWTPAVLAALAGMPGAPAPAEPAPKDFTAINLADHGIKSVDPSKDPKTGFTVGGKNATALIRGLAEINGKRISDLERAMRPGALSGAGFLGKDEKLL